MMTLLKLSLILGVALAVPACDRDDMDDNTPNRTTPSDRNRTHPSDPSPGGTQNPTFPR